MTNKLRQFLIAAHGESPDVSDRLLELTYPKEVAAFEAGENANALAEWHDLRKNPDDLPPNEHEVYIAVVNETARGKELIYRFDRYLTDDEAWFIESAQEIIAWCEIPKFEEAKDEG